MSETTTRRKRTLWPLRLLLVFIIIMGVSGMLGGRRPDNLGVQDGRLAPCPDTPNCVSTQATDDTQAVAPLAYDTDLATAQQAVKSALQAMPRTTIIRETEDYFHAECRSRLFRFVDDLEVWIDTEHQRIHARSASRLGYSDLGVNRQRVAKLFEQIATP